MLSVLYSFQKSFRLSTFQHLVLLAMYTAILLHHPLIATRTQGWDSPSSGMSYVFAITDLSAVSLQSFKIAEHFLPFQWCNIIRKRCRRSSTNQTKARWTCSTCPPSPDSLTLIDDWVGRSQVSKEQRYFRSCWRHHTSTFWIPAGILKASFQEQDECWWRWDREQPTHTCCSPSCSKT